MRLAKTPLWAATLLLLGACTDKQPAAAPAAAQAPPAASASAAPAAVQSDPVAVEVPAPGRVLDDIYGHKGDGSASYTIDNNALASFWYGDRFDLGGKHYYTGFANAGPGKYGKPEEENPDPAVGVSISQATYVLDRADGKPTWTLFHAQRWVGDFGSNEKADTLDQKRKPQSTQTKDGHLLLALPTTRFADGITSSGFAVFTFDPNKNDLGDYKGWVYLGTVATGEDNGAACDDQGTMKCAASTGTLSFEPGSGPMPGLRVAMSGTAIAGPGKVRSLGPADVVSYTYDAAKQQYTPPLDR
ncbi:hypothetical protein A6R71_14135 [Xanthomonas translucens pv. arrhenatheri]|uniref:Lipoprotein n=1 Tax=Xanthomonas graminis pv. arrhenatheri LMG 727 TaxID=1195923 RepID=A0A0K2ZCN2_9XANT|nr:hypothetical protein [Xanthomonas translucens]OAX63600.1 hypothetical protein A6R71_14135 [Xanthomonas translucens pv. arrhenatheri]UKE78118.1 hypothetical protein KM317_02380 [Xanthomonas translucens pv. arrhenatheri]CTP82963.1 hypothetical protein XTALMG727_0464 [Xanthomonas translucens pv. arrhenatheri LMG 727]